MNTATSIGAPPSQRLKGKVAIITGGASGLGKSTTKLFVQHGAKVVIADVQDEQAHSLCNEINDFVSNTNHQEDRDEGEIVSYIHCDVSNEDDVKNLIDLTMSKHGKLDIMFNNAGIFGDPNISILKSTSENFMRVFETNVIGSFLGAKYAAQVMIPQKSGIILFTASVATALAGEGPYAYMMSKHAILGLMKNLCVEMGQYGIRVNAVSPGAYATPLTMRAFAMGKEELDEMVTKASALKGVVPDPLDVAHAALFLASDEARFVSGANIFVDGGTTVVNAAYSAALKKPNA